MPKRTTDQRDAYESFAVRGFHRVAVPDVSSSRSGQPVIVGFDQDGQHFVQLVLPVDTLEEQRAVVRWGASWHRGRPSSDHRDGGRNDPARSLADAIGDFYTPGQLTEFLDLTPKALQGRAARGRYLRLFTSDHKSVYPAAQFDETGDVPDGLGRVVQALNRYYRNDDGWSAAFWLTGPIDVTGEDRRTHLEVLRAEGPERILAEVRQMEEERNAESSVVDHAADRGHDAAVVMEHFIRAVNRGHTAGTDAS